MQYIGLYVFSVPIYLKMIVRIRALYFIITIKSEVWPICHCLGFGHETMVCAVYLFIFLLHWTAIYRHSTVCWWRPASSAGSFRFEINIYIHYKNNKCTVKIFLFVVPNDRFHKIAYKASYTVFRHKGIAITCNQFSRGSVNYASNAMSCICVNCEFSCSILWVAG